MGECEENKTLNILSLVFYIIAVLSCIVGMGQFGINQFSSLKMYYSTIFVTVVSWYALAYVFLWLGSCSKV